MPKPRNPHRLVDLDQLAEDDRKWLEAEAERIAADPATLVRMMIRQARVGGQARIGPAPRVPFVPTSAYREANDVLPAPIWRGDPHEAEFASNGTHVDVDDLVERTLEQAETTGAIAQPGAPAAAAPGVQVVGGRAPTPFTAPLPGR